MPAALLPLTIDNNADFNLLLVWTDQSGTPINLTGYMGAMNIASNYLPTRTVYWSLSSTGGNPEITFPDPATGKIQLLIPASNTAGFTFSSAVYDLVLTAPDNSVLRLIQGPVTISPGVTPA